METPRLQYDFLKFSNQNREAEPSREGEAPQWQLQL
jgi:hypothetical protein